MSTPGSDQLVLSHFSLARDHPLDDRIRAAAAAGFDGIGFFAGQYPVLGDGWSAPRIHELLDRHGVVMAEVEALSGWGASIPSDRYLEFEQLVWMLVDEFDVPYVQAIGPVDGSITDAGRRFGELCDRGAEHGATVGLEFLPFTNIVDATDAVAVVEAADRPNGGVCADIWHHVRGADDLDLIRRIPPELLVRVQMSDGPAAPTLDDYKDDCLRYRVPPGDGAFDVDGFVAAVLDLGYSGPWDLEVCNDDVWGRPPDEHVAGAAAGMRRVLERVRSARTTHARTRQGETA
jgi:sugar phosphate isomerase/epimerase